jgi:hypothetical protein
MNVGTIQRRFTSFTTFHVELVTKHIFALNDFPWLIIPRAKCLFHLIVTHEDAMFVHFIQLPSKFFKDMDIGT